VGREAAVSEAGGSEVRSSGDQLAEQRALREMGNRRWEMGGAAALRCRGPGPEVRRLLRHFR
jgi:hypothetical protein